MVRLAFQVIRNTEIPSIVFTCDNQRYIFNVPETFQRFYREHRIKMTPGPVFFYTRSSTETFSGIIGMMLTLFQERQAIDSRMYGPSAIGKLLSVLRYNDVAGFKTLPFSYYDFESNSTAIEGLKRLTMIEEVLMRQNDCRLQEQLEEIRDLNIRTYQLDDRNDAGKLITDGRYEDQNLIVVPLRLHGQAIQEEQKNQHMQAVRSIQYAVISRKQPGSVDEEKLKELKIEKSKLGQLFKTGHLTMTDGSVVKVEEIRTSEVAPQMVLILDLSNESEITELLNHSGLQELMGQVKQGLTVLQCVVHLSRPAIVETPAYSNLLQQFHQYDNLLCNHESTATDELTLLHKSFQLRSVQIARDLNQLFPSYFPKVSNQQLPPLPAFNRLLGYFPLYEYLILPSKQVGYRPLSNIEPDSFVKKQVLSQDFLQQVQQLPKPVSGDARRLTFLGTGSMKPGKYRNVSGILLSQPEGNILLDCGEGTWKQIVDHGIALLDRDLVLWISHAHSDHHLGMLNLMHQIEHCESFKSQLFVVVPALMIPWLHYYQHHLKPFTKAQITTIQALTQPIKTYQLLQEAFASQRIRDGTVSQITETDIAGLVQQVTSNAEAMKKHILGSMGVQLECVPVVHCPQAYGIAVQWKDDYKITYSGDTRPCQQFGHLSRDANIMIHEATFSDDLKVNAIQNDHATIREAVELAIESNCANLVLTHFSQRFAKTAVNQKSKKKEKEVPQVAVEPDKYPDAVYHDYRNNKSAYALDHLSGHVDEYQAIVTVSHLIGSMIPDDE